MEENVGTTENTEGSDCTLKTELVIAEALMSPLFVPTESEPDIQGTLKNSIMDQNLKATQNMHTNDLVCDKFKMKKNINKAEASFASSFLLNKAEPDFEKTSPENIVEDTQGSSMIEIGASRASFLVKEEPIDYEETWQNNVKLEPKSPLSMNSQSGESYKYSKDGVNVKIEDYVKDEELSEEFSSKGHPLSAMEGTPQKHFGGRSFSSSSKTVQLPRFGCQNELAAESCSPAETTGEEEAADAKVSKRHVEQQRAGGSRKQHSDQSEKQNCTQDEELHFQTGMLQSGSLGSSTGEGCLQCSYCGKDFKAKCYLIRHVRIHTGDRHYKCSQCGISFTQSTNLRRHMLKHTGDRPYKCSQCGKSFTTSGHLTGHMRTHSGDRPYKCSQCGKSFTESGSLTKHMRTHTGDRPYKCSQCGKCFTESCSLTRHMRSHSGDRPYKCSQCGKSFTESCSLNRHLRKCTREQCI